MDETPIPAAITISPSTPHHSAIDRIERVKNILSAFSLVAYAQALPPEFASDISLLDATKKIEKATTDLTNVTTAIAASASNYAQKQSALAKQKKVAMKNRTDTIAAAKKKYNERVLVIQNELKEAVLQAKTDYTLTLSELKTTRATLKTASNEVKIKKEGVQISQEELLILSQKLSGVVLAAFPGKKNADLRDAILSGNAPAVKILLEKMKGEGDF